MPAHSRCSAQMLDVERKPRSQSVWERGAPGPRVSTRPLPPRSPSHWAAASERRAPLSINNPSRPSLPREVRVSSPHSGLLHLPQKAGLGSRPWDASWRFLLSEHIHSHLPHGAEAALQVAGCVPGRGFFRRLRPGGGVGAGRSLALLWLAEDRRFGVLGQLSDLTALGTAGVVR